MCRFFCREGVVLIICLVVGRIPEAMETEIHQDQGSLCWHLFALLFLCFEYLVCIKHTLCEMKAVIDSSTLISLAKADCLDVLASIGCDLACPPEVYDECVSAGILLGRPDASEIKRLFVDGTVSVKEVSKRRCCEGISEADASVLSLALQENASYVFVNDIKLSRRIGMEGFVVRGSPDILLRMKHKGALSAKRYAELIAALIDKKRLSESNAKKYLEDDSDG